MQLCAELCLPSSAQHTGRCGQCPALGLAAIRKLSVYQHRHEIPRLPPLCPPGSCRLRGGRPSWNCPSRHPQTDRIPVQGSWIVSGMEGRGGIWAPTALGSSAFGTHTSSPPPAGVNSLRDPCTSSQLPSAKPSAAPDSPKGLTWSSKGLGGCSGPNPQMRNCAPLLAKPHRVWETSSQNLEPSVGASVKGRRRQPGCPTGLN